MKRIQSATTVRLLSAAALAGSLLAGCGGSAQTASDATEQPATEQPATRETPTESQQATPSDDASGGETIAFIPGLVGIPFYTSMQCGAQDAADEFGVELTWQGPQEFDLEQQTQVIQAVVQQDPDGIGLVPTDPSALVSVVQGIVDAGVPVVTVDGSLAEPIDIQNIRSDNVAAGGLAASDLADAVGGEGEVLVVGLTRGVTANDERVDGFVQEIEQNYPDIELLPVAYPGTDVTKAAEATAATIQGNPDLKGIYTTHSSAASGAANAVLGAGRQGELKVVAYDADPQQVNDLKEGLYDALVVQTPYQQGYDAIELLVSVIRGEIGPDSVDYQVFSPIVIATRENIDDPEVSQYLYRTNCG